MSGIPREVIFWLQSLDLTYKVKNPKRDLTNGFIIGEILARFYPKELDMHSFDNGFKLDVKLNNWDFIQRFCNKHPDELPLQPKDYDGVIHCAPNAGLNFLFKFYTMLTSKKAVTSKLVEEEIVPDYAKPTIANRMKDKQLIRIADTKVQNKKAEEIIIYHNETLRNERQNPSKARFTKHILDRYTKRLVFRESFAGKDTVVSKKRIEEVSRGGGGGEGDVRQVKVKTGGRNMGMKKKKDTNESSRRAGLAQSHPNEEDSHVISLDSILNDIISHQLITKLNKAHPQYKAAKDNSENMTQFFPIHVGKFDQDLIIDIITEIADRRDEIVNTLLKNMIDFCDFAQFFSTCFGNLAPYSQSFISFKEIIADIGNGMLNIDPQSTELFFLEYALQPLQKIFEANILKCNELIYLLYCYIPNTTNSHMRVLEMMKTKLKSFEIYIYCLSTIILYENIQLDSNIYNLYFSNAKVGLLSTSPFTRTKALSILSILSKKNFTPILPILDVIKRLSDDYSWELRSQIIILCSNILVNMNYSEDMNVRVGEEAGLEGEEKGRRILEEDGVSEKKKVSLREKEKESSREEEEEKKKSVIGKETTDSKIESVKEVSIHTRSEHEAAEEEKQENVYAKEVELIFEIIHKTFNVNSPKPTQKIGLIYLAKILNFYYDYNETYLNILLNIPDRIRNSVLDVKPLPGSEEEVYVLGAFTEKYRTFGAPLEWNSLYIADVLQTYIKANDLVSLEEVHIDVFESCLFQEFVEEEIENWLVIFQNLKNYFFIALCDRDLSLSSIEILKKFFCHPKMQEFVIENCKEVFIKTLTLLYRPDCDQECKENIKDFLEFLHDCEEGNAMLKDFVYVVIKSFADEAKKAFHKSNLIKLVNRIVQQRRGDVYSIPPEEITPNESSSSFKPV